MSGDLATWLWHGVLAGLGAFLFLLAIVTEAAWSKRQEKEDLE